MNPLQTIIIILAATASALGQGIVDFRNGGVSFPTPADRRVYGAPCVPLVGTNYVAVHSGAIDVRAVGVGRCRLALPAAEKGRGTRPRKQRDSGKVNIGRRVYQRTS